MIHLESLSGGFKIGKVKSCDVLDCLFNDKKYHCTAKAIDVRAKGGCITYKQDMKWLRHSWWGHEYVWLPVYDDYAQGLIPVRVEEDEVEEDESARE